MTVQIDSKPMESTVTAIAVNTLNRVIIDSKPMENTTTDIQVGDTSVPLFNFTKHNLI